MPRVHSFLKRVLQRNNLNRDFRVAASNRFYEVLHIRQTICFGLIGWETGNDKNDAVTLLRHSKFEISFTLWCRLAASQAPPILRVMMVNVLVFFSSYPQ